MAFHRRLYLLCTNYDLVVCTCYFIWKCDLLNCGSAHYAQIMIEHLFYFADATSHQGC